MNEVQRFDYSKPPPGWLEGRGLVAHRPDEFGNVALADLDGDVRGGIGQTAIGLLWVDFKARHWPPGIAPPLAIFAEQLAAAWSWHDRRHALAARLTLQDAWPRCLRWTDAECDQVDRWIAEGEETPECFWVQLKPIDQADDDSELALHLSLAARSDKR